MTQKYQMDERAKAFARQVLTEDFKQKPSDELVLSVAKKVTRAMPTRTMAKIARQNAACLAAAD